MHKGYAKFVFSQARCLIFNSLNQNPRKPVSGLDLYLLSGVTLIYSGGSTIPSYPGTGIMIHTQGSLELTVPVQFPKCMFVWKRCGDTFPEKSSCLNDVCIVYVLLCSRNNVLIANLVAEIRADPTLGDTINQLSSFFQYCEWEVLCTFLCNLIKASAYMNC